MCVPGPVAACKGILEYGISRSFNRPPLANSFVDGEENPLEVALSCKDLATGLVYHQVHLFEHSVIVQFCLLHPKQWQTLVGVQVLLDISCTMNFPLVYNVLVHTENICLVKTSVHESYTASFDWFCCYFFFSLSFKSTSDKRECTCHIIISYKRIQPTFSELETLVPEISVFSQSFSLKGKSEIWERTCTHRCLETQHSSATHRWKQRWKRLWKVKHCWPEESKWHLTGVAFGLVQKAVPKKFLVNFWWSCFNILSAC